MFYSSQNQLSKNSSPRLQIEEKTRNDITNLQRFYNMNTSEHKRISILMDDSEEQKHVEYINLKQPTGAELNAIGTMMDRTLKKTLWVDDPLRLNLVTTTATATNEQEDIQEDDVQFPFHHLHELPYHFKLKSDELEDKLLNTLYIVMDFHISTELNTEYLMFALELPYATAAFIPPTPPPKQVNTTPAMPPPIILPPELYEIHDEDPTEPEFNSNWLYTRDEDQSTFMTYSPHISATINSLQYFDAEESNKDFTDETWEAIFHPLSTFKHKKGKLEYYSWNPTNLPVAAARAAHRVTNARAFGPDFDFLIPSSEEAVQGEATLPQLAPTPPLKPSPVLTIISDELEKEDSQLTLVPLEDNEQKQQQQDGHYYDMLKHIRGNQRYSNASSLASSLVSSSTMDTEKKQKSAEKPSKLQLIYSVFHPSTNTKSKENEKYNAFVMDEETPVTAQAMMQDDQLIIENNYWTSKRLFCTGFVCPLFWYYGCFNFTAASKARRVNEILWQKRCRLASIYFSVVLSIVVMVLVVKSAGAAGARQAQSDTIRAVIAN